MRTIRVSGSTIPLGRQGEHLVTEVRFPLGQLIDTFGDGHPALLAVRPGESESYPVAITVEDGDAVWVVSKVDTGKAGTGRAELRWYVGDALAKSITYCLVIARALSVAEGETPPASMKSWVDSVIEAGIDARAAAIRADGYADMAGGYSMTAEKAAEEITRAVQAAFNAQKAAALSESRAESAADRAETAAGGISEDAVRDAVTDYLEEHPVEIQTATATRLGGIKVGANLSITSDGTLSVLTADEADRDNTLPITSAAVYTEVGNIGALLATI